MPSIEFVNSNGDANSLSGSISTTLFGVEPGHLLIASYSPLFFTSPILTSLVSDDTGNTWRRMARTATGPPAAGNYYSVETWVALSAVGGDTTVTAQATGGGTQVNTLTVAEFKIPSTLALFAQGGFFEVVGNTPRDGYGPVISLPGPGLLWSASGIENNRTELADGFIECQFQIGSGVNLSCAYAIEPQPSVNRHGYNFTVNNTDFIATLTAFRDTADSFADDYPVLIGGRGANR